LARRCFDNDFKKLIREAEDVGFLANIIWLSSVDSKETL
jgi:hypothetical protein